MHGRSSRFSLIITFNGSKKNPNSPLMLFMLFNFTQHKVCVDILCHDICQAYNMA